MQKIVHYVLLLVAVYSASAASCCARKMRTQSDTCRSEAGGVRTGHRLGNTRTDIPLDQSPASVSVDRLRKISNKNKSSVSPMRCGKFPDFPLCKPARQVNSLRFSRADCGANTPRSCSMAFRSIRVWPGSLNFADLTTDDIDRIEVVRGPQSTLYGPRALAGVIQIFTKQGEGDPTVLRLARKADPMGPFAKHSRATANSDSSITRSALAGSTPITRDRIINIETPRDRGHWLVA